MLTYQHVLLYNMNLPYQKQNDILSFSKFISKQYSVQISINDVFVYMNSFLNGATKNIRNKTI